jgi:Sulfotransferase family
VNAGPDFFVIGAQKAGTTRLCGILDRHPAISLPTKEPMFFQSPVDMGSKRQWYQDLFSHGSPGVLQGDGSTYYSMRSLYPGTAERIHAFNPHAKLVYMVRHPLRRIESAWVQLLSVGHANAVRGFDHTLRETDLLLDPSRYWAQLNEYRRFFPDDQIAVYFFEDFVADEVAVARSCCAFLGADPSEPLELGSEMMRNASQGKRQRALVVDAVRALPGYERFKRLVPHTMKLFFDDHATRPIPPARWKPETLEWAVAQLREDMAALLAHTGRDAAYWPMP